MSLVLKAAIPVVIIGGLVWLYMTKFPSMANAPQPAPAKELASETSEQAAARSTTDAQLQADLNTLDGDIQGASDASASVDQSFNDQPIQQTE